ncbi:MAG: flagellar hook-basal body protein [Defluviitoga tunisiensis]|jgi:flagellar basal-body rod protein FlgF|nr:flagellar hook-basal body protein [Defluviitoga tunisiensis]MDY0378937.1 flagellar hook-basal body protein [Defluviitoga tunisiensis]HHV01623.1 flagellar hook-basal body protein [Defluviitoga tunisiensis]HOB55475.1 flagellar hook-basal body protein [Defluviitoga tunisiensis]HOK16129.1 flagellar hook-basal body protein [Defluviitoga tunisiensis]
MRGIYAATAGMLNSFAELDSIANNLANANTVGYKKDYNIFKSYYEKEIRAYQDEDIRGKTIGNIYSSVILDEVIPNFEQGPLSETNNSLDFAINGQGFFKIQRNDNFYYTRDGEFTINNQGFLVNKNGDFVLDAQNNPILVDTDDFFVLNDGSISGTNIRLNIVNLDNITKYGNNYFTGEEIALTQEDYEVKQGYLEGSNINVLNEMIKMIEANRKFDILQQAISSTDSLNAKLIEISSF